MKFIILSLSLICFTGSVSASTIIPSADNSKLLSDLNRATFYKAMESDDKTLVDAQISELNSAPSATKNAFLGAMTMRRAGIGGNPVSKLALFKKGHKLLEAAIKQDPDNTEFRFLRLMIQENAPGILGYKVDEEKDSEFIRKSYKSLPEDLQKTIADYNKTSKVLKLQVS
jgi:hypothetical protein